MTRELSVAYHNLSIMLEAGMPIVRSLNTVASGSTGKFRKAFAALAEGISAGNSFAETIGQHPEVFAALDTTLMEAADKSGNLSESLKHLSRWYEFRGRLRNLLISGSVLPLVLIHITIMIAPLPGLFLGQINSSQYVMLLAKALASIYLPVVIIYALWHVMRKPYSIRRLLDRFILRIPVLGQAVRHLAISRYCWAFNMLYKAGVPITQCAETSLTVMGNSVVADLFRGGAQSAQAGELVWEGFSRKLPADFLHLWQIGEETGDLDKTVERLANNTGATAELLLTEFCRWLPRLLYFLILIVMALLIFRSFLTVMRAAPI